MTESNSSKKNDRHMTVTKLLSKGLEIKEQTLNAVGLKNPEDPFKWKTIAKLSDMDKRILLVQLGRFYPEALKNLKPSMVKTLTDPMHPTHLILELQPKGNFAQTLPSLHGLMTKQEADALARVNPLILEVEVNTPNDKNIFIGLRVNDYVALRITNYATVERRLAEKNAYTGTEKPHLCMLAEQALQQSPVWITPITSPMIQELQVTEEALEKNLWQLLNIRPPTRWQAQQILSMSDTGPDPAEPVRILLNRDIKHIPSVKEEEEEEATETQDDL